jgi:hypothetical protein
MIRFQCPTELMPMSRAHSSARLMIFPVAAALRVLASATCARIGGGAGAYLGGAHWPICR